ncbi:hypothetical protein [Hydromonas duriensis]|uniref:Uncharacterized protein n=1 Tax=Hydromonas duriensis TaxID=1527608 RepID=A0A4R6Y485_9BURK|nr:hypothetical protein [Hydromonas duriensis]TDR27053.1 hypothetical protein DFR44_1482 [Hydromonas duriensis]
MTVDERKTLMDAHVYEYLIRKRDKRLTTPVLKESPEQSWSKSQAMEWVRKVNLEFKTTIEGNE